MADELISREALREFPIRLNHYDKEHGNEHFVLGVESVLEYAETLPSVDAVEVVRCRDCKNGELLLNAQGAEYVVCELDEHHVWLPNGFCSYGERKEDSETSNT